MNWVALDHMLTDAGFLPSDDIHKSPPSDRCVTNVSDVLQRATERVQENLAKAQELRARQRVNSVRIALLEFAILTPAARGLGHLYERSPL